MIPSLRIKRRGEWFAGEPFSIGQDSRTDPSGVSCPRKDILAHSDAICNSGVAKVFENDSLSRQIDIVRPPQRLAAPVQDDILSQVWSAYKRSARKPESLQLLLTGILPRRMTLRRV